MATHYNTFRRGPNDLEREQYEQMADQLEAENAHLPPRGVDTSFSDAPSEPNPVVPRAGTRPKSDVQKRFAAFKKQVATPKPAKTRQQRAYDNRHGF